MTTATPRRDPDARPRATYQDVLDAPPHEVAEIAPFEAVSFGLADLWP